MDETYNLKVKVRLKGFDGEVEYEVPRIFVQYNTDGKKLGEVTEQAIKLYKALAPPQAQEE